MGRVIKVTILDSGILQTVPQNAFSGENNAVQLNCYCSDSLKDFTKYIDFESNGVKYRSPAFTDNSANFVFNIPNIISNYNTLFQFVFIEGDKIIKTQKGTIYVQESVNAADQITFESGDILNDFETRINLVEGKVDDFLNDFSIDVGTVSTLPAGSGATVTKTGTNIDTIFNFGIPKGIQGIKGDTGSNLTFGTSWTTALPTTPILNVVYPFAGVNATLISGITWYNGDFAQYNGSAWIRIAFQSLSNYYLKSEVDAMLVGIKSQTDLILTSTGNGTGVSTLRLEVSETQTLTIISGDAKFYTDAAGTIGESITWTVTAGALRTIYLKAPSGTSTIYIPLHDKVVKIGNDSSDGWVSSTNAANLSININKFNLTHFRISGASNITGLIPPTVTYIYLSGTLINYVISGGLPSVITYILINGSSISWQYSGALPSGLTYLVVSSNTLDWTGLDVGNLGNITMFNLANYRITKMSSTDMVTLLTQLKNRTGSLPNSLTINDYADYASVPTAVTNAIAALKAAKTNITTVTLGA